MLSYLNIVENIDIKEVIAMQISGYSSAAMLAYRCLLYTSDAADEL